jgi:chromosome partitioning protein
MPQLVFSVVNPKGGVGKTTVAVHLAVAAHRDGYATTLLDADPQGSALDWHRRCADGYDGPAVRRVAYEDRLTDTLPDAPDVVVVDSPARLDDRTGAALSVADCALVPVRPSALDLWGTAEFLEVLDRHVSGGLTAAFVGSQRDVRTTLSDELEGALSGLSLPMLDGFTMRVAYTRSMAQGETVLDGYDDTAESEVQTLLEDAAGLLS